jgi:hypothetical protein
MRRRQLRWCWAGVLGCALVASADAAAFTGSDEERAREAYKEARRARNAERFDEAVVRFREAWSLYKDPWFMCELGGLEARMGKARDAAEDLTLCLRLLNPDDKKAMGKELERALTKMRAQVGAIKVETNVPRAEVAINGTVMATLPLQDPIFVTEVRAPGYEPATRMAVMPAGSSILMRLRLEPMRAELAPPLEPAPLEPKKEAKQPAPVLATKAPVPVPAPSRVAEPARAPVRAAVILGGLGLSIAGATVGGAGLVAGDTAREEAKTMTRELSENPTTCYVSGPDDPCQKIYDKMDKAILLTGVGIGAVAVSAVGASLIIYELVRSAPQGKTANTQVAVVPAPGGGALKITGSF